MESRMKRCVLALVLVPFLGTADAEAETAAPNQGIRHQNAAVDAFVGARIVTAPGEVIESGTLIVRDGRIEAVGADVEIPADAVVHDLDGRSVYPGFIDPYTEYGLGHVDRLNPPHGEEGPKYEGDRQGADSWNDAVHAERRWVEELRPDDEAASKLRRQGVTSVHSSKMDGIFRGRGFVTALREGLANEVVRQPDGLHLLSWDKGSSEQSYPSSLMGSIALIRQTLLDADWYHRAWNAHRRSPSLEAPELNLALEALAGYDGAFLFQVSDELDLLRAGRIAREMDRPFVYVGTNREYQRLQEIRSLDRPIVLPLHFPDEPTVGSLEEELDVTLADLRHWERAPSNPAVLAENGIEIAFTSHGLEDGEELLEQVRKTIERGLSEERALAALTTVPANLLGVLDDSGTLEEGKRADFLIAGGDLFSEEGQLLSVWIDGVLAEEIEPLKEDEETITGTWEIDLEDTPHTLTLTEVAGELKGTLKTGETTHELERIVPEFGRYHFKAPYGPEGGEGLTRFTIHRIAERVTGKAVTPEGRAVAFALEPVEEEPDTKEEEGLPPHDYVGDEERTPEEIVSRLTYPDMAFGFQELPEPETVLVRNATIWTSGPRGILEGADLLVRDGKIVEVGENLSAGDARILDAGGQHVTPGIIDEHSHVAISRGVNEGSHAVTAEVRIGDVVDSDDIGIYRALAGGTTAAQLLHGSANPIGGQAQVVKFRWGASPEEMKLEGAPPSIKFALGENVKQSNWGDEYTVRYPQTRMGVETIMKDAFLAAREYREAWNEYEDGGARRRETPNALPPRRDLQMEALLEILDRERFVHCHSYVQSEILMLMRLAEELDFRIQTFTHILEGYKVAPEMAEHGAGGSSFSDWWTYKFEVYDAIPQNTCLMHRAGVVTSVNSDSSELIRRLNQEAAKSVLYCGMDEEEALKMVTINPARQLKIDDRVGSLEAGKDADFVIWNGPPLSVHSRPDQTWIDGALYFSRERDAELRERDRREKQALIQKAIAEPGNGKKPDTHENEGPEWDCEDTEDVWHAYAD